MAAVVVGLTMTAWAKKPDKPGGGKPGGGDGGSVGTGTIYYASGGLWSMNPDGSGKTPLLAGGGDASITRHPAEGDRWFLQVQEIDGFYPITTFPPEPLWVLGLDDLEAVGFTGDPDPGIAWGSITYYIEIDGVGNPDTFKWSASDMEPVIGVPITGFDQPLIIGSTVLTIRFDSTTGHALGDPFGDWWSIRVVKTQRSELFAVSEDGQIEVQLTDDPTVQPWRPGDPSRAMPRWATDYGVVDGKVSYLAQRWGQDDIVTERGLFAAQIDPETLPYGNPIFQPVQPTMLPVSLPLDIEVLEMPYAWSPEGERIVYAAGGQLYVADAYNVEVPIRYLCDSWSPAWSPALEDGTSLIAFQVGSWGDAQIRTISPDGSSETTVVTAGKNRAIRGDLIHWSPMGTHLVYTLIQSKGCRACQYNDSYDVYRVAADGSGPTNLTSGVSELCFSLNWRD
jgi:hypothetical protein